MICCGPEHCLSICKPFLDTRHEGLTVAGQKVLLGWKGWCDRGRRVRQARVKASG